MSDHWDVYLSADKTLVRVDLGMREHVPIDDAKTLIQVNIKSRKLFSKKLDFELIGAVEDEIDSQLTAHDFVVGAITYTDSKSFYYYTKQKNSLFDRLNKILSQYRKLKCEIAIAEDPEWGFYLNALYPDVYEIRWKMDSEVVKQLEANQDNLNIPREINHWIYFPEYASRENFKRNLDSDRYKIIGEDTLQESDFPFQLVISHTSSAEFETINHITTELLKKAIEAGGNYDGWESPVIRE